MISLLCAAQDTPESRFWWDVLKLAVGFLLTTVFGGSLGWWLQSRSWAHQNRARLREVEYSEAAKLFDEVSRLMDKRFYRMARLNSAIASGASKEALKGEIEKHCEARQEWNYSLNRNVGLTESYFGPDIRQRIGNITDVLFQDIANELEDIASAQLRHSSDDAGNIVVDQDLAFKTKSLNEKMSILGPAIYKVNEAMIANLRSRQKGLLEPKKLGTPTAKPRA